MAGRRSNYKKIKRVLAQTPGATKLYTDWQNGAEASLKNLIENSKAFNADVAELRVNKQLSLDEKTLLLVSKYLKHGLMFAATELVRHYLEADEINSFFMRPPVIAVSTKENIAGPSVAHSNGASLKQMMEIAMQPTSSSWVYLILDAECTKEDMLEWVNNNWDWFLQDRLDAIKPYKFARVRVSSYSGRDQEIYEHIKVNHLPAKDIASKYNITPEYARKIASRTELKLRQRDK